MFVKEGIGRVMVVAVIEELAERDGEDAVEIAILSTSTGEVDVSRGGETLETG